MDGVYVTIWTFMFSAYRNDIGGNLCLTTLPNFPTFWESGAYIFIVSLTLTVVWA